MADRSQMLASPAYAALSSTARRVLQVIEVEVARGNGVAAISFGDSARLCGTARSTACLALRLLGLLGFINIEPGRVRRFTLCDGWQSLDAVEAKRLRRQTRLPMVSSAAFRSLPPISRAVLRVVEEAAALRGSVTMSQRAFAARLGRSRSTVSNGVRTLVAFGFVHIAGRGGNEPRRFFLSSDWRSVSAHEAKRLKKIARLGTAASAEAATDRRPADAAAASR